MNIGIFLMAGAAWLILFLQALHVQPNDLAPYFFFGAGVAQWVAGAAFPGLLKEWRNGEWRLW